MQSITENITEQLAANRELLSGLIKDGRMDEATAEKHMESAEMLAKRGVALELRVLP